MSERLERDLVYLGVAILFSKRATCPRRQVGCVLVDKHGRILSTGYNGVPAGHQHCTDVPCSGAGEPSGQGLDKCEAIHAEQNAILLLRDPWAVEEAFLTTFPCMACLKLLLGTSCKRIVFIDTYAGDGPMKMWLNSGRSLERYPFAREHLFSSFKSWN